MIPLTHLTKGIRKGIRKTFLKTSFLKISFLKASLRFGSLRRLTPVSNIYGFDRGTPIDRYYIENFLHENKGSIKGDVLELLNDHYTQKFGGKNVRNADVLDIDTSNRSATIYADLRSPGKLPENRYDCIILTQVLQFIDDVDAAVASAHKMLKPGGTLLCTLPSVSRIDCVAKEAGDYWRFTKASAVYLFTKHFNAENSKATLEISSFGNVFVAICFLEGIALEEIKKKELDYVDPNFPLIICVKAVKEPSKEQ